MGSTIPETPFLQNVSVAEENETRILSRMAPFVQFGLLAGTITFLLFSAAFVHVERQTEYEKEELQIPSLSLPSETSWEEIQERIQATSTVPFLKDIQKEKIDFLPLKTKVPENTSEPL
jgi:hypothetical protein